MLELYLALLQEPISNIDWSAMARLVPEVVVVIIFVAFTLKRDERQTAKDLQSYTAYLTSNESRDEQWRIFLKEERDSRREMLAQVVNKLETLTILISNTNAQLIQHDAGSKISSGELMARIEGLKTYLEK